jgi:hypothetical protein
MNFCSTTVVNCCQDGKTISIIKQCTEFDQVIYIVDVIKAHSEIVLAFSNAHKAI